MKSNHRVRKGFYAVVQDMKQKSWGAMGNLLLNSLVALSLAMTPTLGMANPEGGVVVSGDANIVSTPAELQIHQNSNNALIEWNSFNIDKGETTRFYQPGADSIAVNRVVNADQLSTINGNLIANGKVVVINPNGVMIGADGNVDTNSFVATSADIDTASFNQDKGVLNFNRAGKANAVVENNGKISVAEKGIAALVAPTARNNGIIQGNLSKVQMAAADTFAVDFYGDGLMNFAVEPAAGGAKRNIKAENKGQIITDGGAVLMTAAAASDIVDSVINQEGVVKAASLQNRGGKIVLAAAGAKIKVSGDMDVSGKGDANGGEILVGGDFQGQGDVPHAKSVEIASSAKLSADGGDNGDGGKIVAWSTQETSAKGQFTARGGSQSGNGGLIETSSEYLLDVNGIVVNTLAPNGLIGMWLLDPENINIVASGIPYDPAAHDNVPVSGGTANIDVASINSALSNVILAASNNVTFSANVNIATAGVGLSVYAGDSIASGNIFAVDYNRNGGSGLTIRREAGEGTINLLNQYIRTNNGDVFFLAGDKVNVNNSTVYTRGGDITMVSGLVDINNSKFSTGGGDILLKAIQIVQDGGHHRPDIEVTEGRVKTNNSLFNTTSGASGSGSSDNITLKEDGDGIDWDDYHEGYGNDNNTFSVSKKGGDIEITGERIGGNHNCFAAGGNGCAVTDPFTPSIIAITVYAKALEKIFGDVDPFLDFTYTPGVLVAGDSFTGGLTRAVGENVGSYLISQGSLAIAALGGRTYNITYVSNYLNILKAQMTITALNQIKTYGDEFVFNTTTVGDDFTVSGLKAGNTITGVSLNSLGAPATADVDGYDINVGGATGANGFLASNYDITYAKGTMTVNPAQLTLTANDAVKTYGDTKTFVGNEYTAIGAKNGDTFNVTFNSAGAPAPANVGDYAIVASNASGPKAGNYVIAYVDGNLKVVPAGLFIDPNDRAKTYGDNMAFGGTEFTAYGLKNGDTVDIVNLFSTGAPASADVGSYNINGWNATGTGLSNYTISYGTGTLTVNKAGLIITAVNQNKTYGDSLYFDEWRPSGDFTVSGLKNGNQVDKVDLYSAGASNWADVGNYNIDIGNAKGAYGTKMSNYAITYVDGNLAVNKAALTITADNQYKTYGDNLYFDETRPSDDFTVSGLKNGNKIDKVDLYSAGASNWADVGDYNIDIGNAKAAYGTKLSNYAITYVDGNLKVNPAVLKVIAESGYKVYGDEYTFDETNPGDFYVLGLKNHDKVNSVDLASNGAPETAHVGFYNIDISNAQGKGLGNYVIKYIDGVLKVVPAFLVVEANDATKTYGDDYTFNGTEFTANGLKNNDTVDTVDLFSFGAPASADVGNYSIYAWNAQGTGLSNYIIKYKKGEMVVDPASLIVTANDDAKDFDGLPYFGGNGVTYSGFKNGQDESVLGGALAYSGSSQGAVNVGNYVITPGGFNARNYVITYVNGSLAINAQPIGPNFFIDALGRPVISVANQALVLDAPFEAIETLELNTDVNIAAGDTGTPNIAALANIEPAAGKNSKGKKAKNLADIEPAAGPSDSNTPASRDINCGNNFLQNKPCADQVASVQ